MSHKGPYNFKRAVLGFRDHEKDKDDTDDIRRKSISVPKSNPWN
jgi:hypothetical protein